MSYLWLCPICLVLAAVFIAVERAERYVEADVIKGAASLAFVILGWLGSMRVSAGTDPSYVRLIVDGLCLGAIADVVLNLRYAFDEPKGKIAFLAGILVFLCGHILYLCAVLKTSAMPWLFVAIGLVLTGFLMAWIFQRIEASLVFKVFGVFYVGAIMVMTCVAVGALIARPCAHTLTFLVGALLFLLSDIILILNTFGRESRFTWRVANLMLYYVGQLLIALSLQML